MKNINARLIFPAMECFIDHSAERLMGRIIWRRLNLIPLLCGGGAGRTSYERIGTPGTRYGRRQDDSCTFVLSLSPLASLQHSKLILRQTGGLIRPAWGFTSSHIKRDYTGYLRVGCRHFKHCLGLNCISQAYCQHGVRCIPSGHHAAAEAGGGPL